MRRFIRRITLGVALLGIGVGAGGILLSPAPAVTGDNVKHVDEDANCVSGCNRGTDICCVNDPE